MKNLLFVFAVFCGVPVFANLSASTSLSELENREINERINEFYRMPFNSSVMHRRIPKFGIQEQKFVEGNEFLRSEEKSNHPLAEIAQKKIEPAFQRDYCNEVLAKRFPEISCGSEPQLGPWSGWEPDDLLPNLTHTWIEGADLAYTLDEIPPEGRIASSPWSDDYWKLKYGGISYRYSQRKSFQFYEHAIYDYAQPTQWVSLLSQVAPGEIPRFVTQWSPAEKYDLSLGDQKFSLTNQQKNAAMWLVRQRKRVEDWMGLCHGWAAASVMVPRPLKSVDVTGLAGVPVTWYQNDIKALLTLLWSNAKFESSSIGKRCNIKSVPLYQNGRVADGKCFDNNPATFHLALGNLVGRKQIPFLMDASFDYEIWNHAIQSYSITYFNPLNSSRRSPRWRDVAVPYDWNFKSRDRFQYPRTRGVRTDHGYNDSGIRWVVGAITTVVYLNEVTPTHSSELQTDAYKRVTYTYDLELYQSNGQLKPMGGEWHSNAHPDFLWIPNRNSFAGSELDRVALNFTGTEVPSGTTTALSIQASQRGLPLCQVVKHLVSQSSGAAEYRCPPTH
jgi:hypothetical protein